MDEELVRRAVSLAHPNALRTALYQATGNPALAQMRVEGVPIRRGVYMDTVVAPEHLDTLRRLAVEFLTGPAVDFVPESPTAERLRELMGFTAGRPVTDIEFELLSSCVGFDELPRQANWRSESTAPEGFRVAIVGCGFSGIAMGVQLSHLGIEFDVYERRSELGGVWSVNTYPDARVDTLSTTYEFSFVKNYPWAEYFARQADVREYLEFVAKKYGVFDRIRFNADVLEGDFDESTGQWTLSLGDGSTVTANVVITGSGLFATPRELDCPGVGDFKGEIVHSTAWRPDIDIAGKNVAIIGNGSTGVQMLSRIASTAAKVFVHQRSPQWITPRERYGDPVSPEIRWLLDTMPYYWNWSKFASMLPALDTHPMLFPDPEWQAGGGRFNQRIDTLRENLVAYINTELDGHFDLIEKLVPAHLPMARRMVVDNGWYRALTRENVELVTDSIARVTETGILTKDGVDRPVDVIILAIGFSVEKFLFPTTYRGRSGVNLEQIWAGDGGARAHLSLAVPGLPNFFMLYGPNGQQYGGGFGLPLWIELWTAYIGQLLVQLVEGGHRSVEVRREAYQAYNTRLDRRSGEMIFQDPDSRSRNYYLNAAGRQQVNAPWAPAEYFRMLEQPDPDEYVFE